MNLIHKAYSIYSRKLVTKISLVIFTVLLFSNNSGAQTTVTIGASKDNTLYEDSLGAISNGAGKHFFAGMIDIGGKRRGLIAFDIVGNIPPCATITSVALTLHMSRTIAGPRTVQLRKVLQNWGEGNSSAMGGEGDGAPAETGDATWLHTFYNTSLWANPGGAFSNSSSSTALVGVEGFYTWSSTFSMVGDVQSWLNNPSGNFGWLLLGDESVNTTAKRFDTRQNNVANFRPKLNVTYTLNSLSLNLTALIEGFWNGTSMVSDTVKVFLRNATAPFNKIDSATVKLDSLGNAVLCFRNAPSGSYFIAVTHRNSIETWSRLPQAFNFGTQTSYNFTTAANQAFGNNLVLKNGRYTIYSGDVNQDGIVDASDLSLVDNDAFTGVSGYVPTDLNGDGFVDASDLSIADNNAFRGVMKLTP